MDNLKYSVGIDVSMKDIHCCLSVIDASQEVKIKSSHKFVNGKQGFGLFAEWIKKHAKESLPIVFVMEATGVYHEQLAWFLYGQGKRVSILLPNKAKKYLQAQGTKSKNDKMDAKGLSRLGAEKKLEGWTPASPELYTLRSYTRQHQSLNETLSMFNNQLHSIEHAQFQNQQVVKQLKESMCLIERQVKEMEKAISDLIKSDPILNMHYLNITAIKGMGMLSFAVIVSETNGFALFKNARHVVSYAGYDVIENQSGSHVGRTRISKKGNPRIRRVLLMPAFCAVRDDQPQFKNLYDRIYDRNKIKMKAYVAVQKKLLVMAYHLWKKEEKYNPVFIAPHKESSPRQAGATHDESLKGTLT